MVKTIRERLGLTAIDKWHACEPRRLYGAVCSVSGALLDEDHFIRTQPITETRRVPTPRVVVTRDALSRAYAETHRYPRPTTNVARPTIEPLTSAQVARLAIRKRKRKKG